MSPKSNQISITLVSYLTYFILSSMLAPIGILSGPMAEHFDQSITNVTKQFSWLTGGILIGAVIALFIFDWIGLRKLFIAIYALIALVLISFVTVDSLESARYLLLFVGVGSGVGLAGAAITISHSYSEDRKASMLVITDGSFSVAGFVIAWTATYLVSQDFGWGSTYQLIGFLAATVAILAALSTFPNIAAKEHAARASPWPISVWLCVISLFLYTLGQYSMLFWLPNYATTILGAQSGQAGSLIGQFWLGMFFAQVFVAWWVLKVGVRRLVLIASGTTLCGSLPLWNVSDIEWLIVLAMLWGFSNLALLKVILSFATEMVKVPGARLVSLLLLGATAGTAVSPYVTSQIVEWTDTKTILIFGSGCYGALFILMLGARNLNPRRSCTTI
jgi:TsgA-like MFS transporter